MVARCGGLRVTGRRMRARAWTVTRGLWQSRALPRQPSEMERARYIAVEGPIGVGKTTLATALAERLGGRTVLEVVEENPFLAPFYQDPRKLGFQTQLFFLLSRFQQQQQLFQQDLFSQV